MSRKYTKYFKASIINMMRAVSNVHNLSQEYVSHYRIILKRIRDTGYENNSDEYDVKKLQKRIKNLEEENEVLKTAAVIMGKK